MPPGSETQRRREGGKEGGRDRQQGRESDGEKFGRSEPQPRAPQVCFSSTASELVEPKAGSA